MELYDTLPQGYSERYGVARSCDTRSLIQGLVMVKTAREIHEVMQAHVVKAVHDLEGLEARAHPGEVDPPIVAALGTIATAEWSKGIHLRLCEQAEATARTNALLERLLEKLGPGD